MTARPSSRRLATLLFAPLLALSVAALACGGDSDGDGAGAAGGAGASNQAGAGGASAGAGGALAGAAGSGAGAGGASAGAGGASAGAGGASAGAGGASAGAGGSGAGAGGSGGNSGQLACKSSSSDGDGCAAEVAGCALDGTWDVATTTPCQPPIANASPPAQVAFATAGGKTCATTAASGVKLEISAGCAAKLTWSDSSASWKGDQCFSCSTYRELTLTVASDGTATGAWEWNQIGECGGQCASPLTVTKK